MYAADDAHSQSSRFSSPPSSPGPYIDSSSPASSPNLDVNVYDDDDTRIPHLSLVDHPQHPFSAARADWKPPDYEKKRPISSITPPPTVKKPRYLQQIPDQPSPTYSTHRTLAHAPAQSKEDLEAEIWAKASEQMVDEGNGRVSLEKRNLTSIPESFIEVLSNFFTPSERSESDYLTTVNSRTCPTLQVTRALNRASTEPANADIWGRPMLRTQSVATVALGLPKNKIQLFLSSNQLSVIPLSLFRSNNLEHLTVLTLRDNNLTHIPPEIVRLKGLQELSIGQNRIRHLPAEILQMSLKSLSLIPNPFMEPPPSNPKYSLGSSNASLRKFPSNISRRRPVSATIQILEQVPSLRELLLRVLLSRADPGTEETLLEAYYELPVEHLGPETAKILDICLTGSVKPSRGRHDADATGTGLCPSPTHQRLGTSRLFVQHAEERYTWETMIAGAEVGGAVPVRWRGCQRGCLDFLDPPEDPVSTPSLPNPTVVQDEDHNMEGVVQVVQFGSEAAEDFDDE